LEILKYAAAKGWRRSIEEILHRVKNERNILGTIK
jgi:hypothetical protein